MHFIWQLSKISINIVWQRFKLMTKYCIFSPLASPAVLIPISVWCFISDIKCSTKLCSWWFSTLTIGKMWFNTCEIHLCSCPGFFEQVINWKQGICQACFGSFLKVMDSLKCSHPKNVHLHILWCNDQKDLKKKKKKIFADSTGSYH